MAQLPDGIKDITMWPHTPNYERLTAAANFYDHASQSETKFLIVDTDDMSPNGRQSTGNSRHRQHRG